VKISAKQYAQVLYDLTEKKDDQLIDDVVLKFAKELSVNNQLNLLENIIEKFNVIWNEHNRIAEAEVVSREKLSSELIAKLNSFIKDKYSAKEVVLKNIVDEKIKGGIIMKVGDELIDGSIKKKMALLREDLKK